MSNKSKDINKKSAMVYGANVAFYYLYEECCYHEFGWKINMDNGHEQWAWRSEHKLDKLWVYLDKNSDLINPPQCLFHFFFLKKPSESNAPFTRSYRLEDVFFPCVFNLLYFRISLTPSTRNEKNGFFFVHCVYVIGPESVYSMETTAK